MNRIGIQANIDKPQALVVAQQAYELLAKRGITPIYEACTAEAICKPIVDDGALDALIVIGGDGTMLRSAVRSAKDGFPMLGVNLGKKGFLTEIEVAMLPEAIDKLVAGHYTVEERMMLCGEIPGKLSDAGLALNDFILFKQAFSHTLCVEVAVNGKSAGAYSCDGIIISTPTGSTAYSLSAGGPVVAPYVNGILITLICPHSLSARPLLVGDTDVVSFSTQGANSLAQVSADGQPKFAHFDRGDVLTIRKAKETARFIHVGDYQFFDLVFKKLF